MTSGVLSGEAPEEGTPLDGAGRPWLLFGSSILLFYGCLAVGGPIALTFKIAVQPAFLVVALGVAVWWIARGGDRGTGSLARWVAALLFAISHMVSIAHALSAPDLSFDGRWYQKEAVLLVSEGWNPYRDPPLTHVPIGPAGLGGSANWHENLGQEILNGYPKSPWIAGAAYALSFDDVEAAKALNLLLALGAMSTAFGALSAMGAGRMAVRGIGAFLLAFAPPTSAQLGTTMVDGQLASLMIMALSFGTLVVRRGAAGWVHVAFGLSLASMMLVKFTGAPYAVAILLGGAVLIARLVDVPASRRFLVAGAGGLAAVFLLAAWNPYLSNAVRFGWPFHPVPGYGPSAVAQLGSPIDAATPENLRGRAGPVKLALSLVSRSESPGRGPVRPKWPWRMNEDELECFAREGGCFVGGHGPLFALCIALAGAGVVILLRRPLSSDQRQALGAALLVTMTVVAMPESWVARYAPQLSFVPVIAWIVLTRAQGPGRRVIALLLGITLIVNATLVLSACLREPSITRQWLKGQIWRLDHDWKRTKAPLLVNFGTFRAFRIILRREGIPYRETPRDLDGCLPVERVFDVIWCAPGHR